MLSFNLLPPGAKQNFITKKQVRIALLWGGSLFLLLAAFVLLLLPSYFNSSLQKEEVLRNLSLTQDSPVVKRITDIRQSVLALKQSAADIEQASKASGIFSDIIRDFVSAVPTGITPTALQFDAQTKKMTMMGLAKDRNALIAFENTLKENPKIADIAIPLSDLVKDFDIPFSLTLTINQ